MVSNMPPVALIQRRWCIGLVIIQGWVQSLVYWLNEFSQSQEHVYNPGWPITSPGVPPKASPHHWLRSRLRNLFNFSALRGTRILCFKLCHFLPLKKKWFSWQQEYGTVIFRPPFWGYELSSSAWAFKWGSTHIMQSKYMKNDGNFYLLRAARKLLKQWA